MRRLLFFCLLLAATQGFAQITVDTTRATVTVREKGRTLTIFRSMVPGVGMRHQITYQPVPNDFGDEPETLKLNFSEEVPHIKAMLDAALQKRQFVFSRISINPIPYTELTNKLVAIYSNSPEWNAYLQKATDLRTTVELFDGSQVAEVQYDTKLALSILEKSDFLKELNAFFAPYGYTVSLAGFPDDHLQTVSTDRLLLLGHNGNLFIPAPNFFFTLTKTKK